VPGVGTTVPGGERFVFAGGLHRSGTTLLARCMAEHPSISGFYGTGVPEDEGQHLQAVYPPGSRFGGPGKFGFDPEAHMTEDSPLVGDQSRREIWHEWSRHWDTERPLLLEKSPPNLIRTRFLQALFPGARFVMLLRHPIAVAEATSKWSHTLPDSLIRHWLVCHETLMADAPRIEHLLVLRYEDLVADLDGRLAEVYRFLGVDPVPAGIAVRAGIDDRYFARWGRRARNPLWRPYLRRLERRYEERLNAFGYSLGEGRTLPVPASSPLARATAGG
jgi:hypothetical protein